MATKEQLDGAQNALVKMTGEIEKVLPKSMMQASDKFMRTIQTAIQLQPALAECSQRSLFSSILKAAADGLVLDGREAALVVFNGKNGKEANYIPMFPGVIKKVRQSGEISVFNSFVVYQNDEFEVHYGMEPSLTHRPTIEGDAGPAIGAYAVCHFKDGGVDVEFMTKGEIERIRQMSKGKNLAPWKDHWPEMARKTVIHRISKRLPMSPEASVMMRRLEEMYDMNDRGAAPAAEPKQRGGGAAALNADDFAGDADVIEGEATEVESETVEPETGEVSEPDDSQIQDTF